MLRIEQFEGDLYKIDLEVTDGVVKFSGLFQQVDGISSKDLIPAENGLKLEAKLLCEE